LRQGVVFYDGTPFTSAAVGPSFDRDSAVNGGPAYMTQRWRRSRRRIRRRVVITLTSANTVFLDYLASRYGPTQLQPARSRRPRRD
jgi:peptide/nickel transport system substrate-binding protein